MFTKEELQLLSQIVNAAQLQGTIQTLPAMLTTLVNLQKKILLLIEGEGPTPAG